MHKPRGANRVFPRDFFDQTISQRMEQGIFPAKGKTMNLDETLHHQQVAAIKAGLAGHEIERQSHFAKIMLCAKRLRELRKSAAETSRMADA